MKKSTLLNSGLSAVIARMGHTETLTIGDCGLPIRGAAERIDLALKKGVPTFLETLDTVLTELCVERAVLAVYGILLIVLVMMFAPPADPGR